MLLVRFSFCECGSVVCRSPRPAQRSVLASSAPRLNVVKARVSKAKRSMAMAPYQKKDDHHNPCSARHDRMPPRARQANKHATREPYMHPDKERHSQPSARPNKEPGTQAPMQSQAVIERLDALLAEL